MEAKEEGQEYTNQISKAQTSGYLIAQNEQEIRRQQQLLYEVLGPVFFGKEQAANQEELDVLFYRQYGVDVQNDFFEGDEHYEEYQEACQAIAEGMTIFSGEIAFEDSALAALAEQIWEDMEEKGNGGFRRINTMLEE